jgi:hypothetical protein
MQVYSGPSRIDGAPIVAILTGYATPTKNVKTGPMAQLWIMRADIEPHTAAKTGEDVSVCGSCPLRRFHGATGGCYVALHQAPLAIFRAWKRGNYPIHAGGRIRSSVEGIRFGAYGDPMALPLDLLRELRESFVFSTGYTHQWRRKGSEGYSALLMASCETGAQVMETEAQGWRAFSTDPTGPGIECASDRIGQTCAECRKCDGAGEGASIWINPHGSGAKKIAGAR